MTEDVQEKSDFARKFIKEKLIKTAKEASEAGISVDVFEALLIALADDLDFKEIM